MSAPGNASGLGAGYTQPEKHDVFVGNLPFGVTEDQLREMFAIVGPVKNVRILHDKETGRPKGFAFVEYYNPDVALMAIRNLNNHDAGGGKNMRVGFAANSKLRDYAKETGQLADMTDANEISGVQAAAHQLPLHLAWDVLDSMKRLVDEDRGTAKALLESQPQLLFALLEIQKRLGVVSSAYSGTGQTYSTNSSGAPAVAPGLMSFDALPVMPSLSSASTAAPTFLPPQFGTSEVAFDNTASANREQQSQPQRSLPIMPSLSFEQPPTDQTYQYPYYDQQYREY